MSWSVQRVVKIWTVLTFVGVILIDVMLQVIWGETATISWQVRSWGSQWPLLSPLLTFAAGALWGHFFWNLSSIPKDD